MSLSKVPGSKYYMADSAGLRDFGKSREIGAETLAAAQRMAGNAQAVGDGTYAASSATVTAGWANERRAGAVVRETSPHWRDARDAILLRVMQSMVVGRGVPKPGTEMVTYTRRDGSTRQATRAQADAWTRQRGGS